MSEKQCAACAKLTEAITEILKFEGKYNRDDLAHAKNVMANIEQIGQSALEAVHAMREGAQNG